MAITTWGLLAKSLIDDEKIEEAIARLILEHSEDETAHLGAGQSLQSHKASEIIDHVVASIISDKILPGTTFRLQDHFCDFIPWVSTDGFVKTLVGTWSRANPKGSLLAIQSGDLDQDKAFIRTTYEWERLYENNKVTFLEFVVAMYDTLDDGISYLFFTASSAAPPVELAAHVGFKIINGRVWASNANGYDQNLTDTGFDFRPTFIPFTRLKIEIKKGTGAYVKFYVNEVLVATHTTYLPMFNHAYLNIGQISTEDRIFSMSLHRVMIQKEY